MWGQYLELGRAAYELGQFNIGDKMLKAALQESGTDMEMCLALAAVFEEAADTLLQNKNQEKAERLFKKALSVYDRVSNDTTNAKACCVLYKLAELSIERNKHEVALRYFGKALIVSRRSHSLPAQLHLSLLKNLAAAWSRKGRHDEAMMVHNKSLQVSEGFERTSTP